MNESERSRSGAEDYLKKSMVGCRDLSGGFIDVNGEGRACKVATKEVEG